MGRHTLHVKISEQREPVPDNGKLRFAVDARRDMADLRESFRRMYSIREGRKLTIVETTETGKPRRRTVTVEGVYPYFITLRIKEGYCITMQWDDFCQARSLAIR